jgi:hypothetical protein
VDENKFVSSSKASSLTTAGTRMSVYAEAEYSVR